MKSIASQFQPSDHYFDLQKESINGGIVSLLAQAGKFFLQIISVVVLARILTPEDYGIFSIALAITMFLSLFKDMGLPLATIQSSEISHKQISAMFWINVLLGIALAFSMLIISPVAGWVFGNPSLKWMLISMSVIFVFHGFMSQPQAILRRQMKYVNLALIDIISMFVAVASAIIAGWMGAGYWALVIMQIGITGITAIGIWLNSSWRPSLPQQNPKIREMLQFGKYVTGTSICEYLSRNIDNLLIGWYHGARELGLYDKAYQMLLIPILQITTPLSGVVIPTLSRINDNPNRFREFFMGSLLVSVGLGMPIAAFLCVSAEKAVLVILGDQWLDSVPIFRALSLAAFLDPFFIGINWIFISLGQTVRMLRAKLIKTSIILIAFIIGLPFGAKGVALAFSLSQSFLLLPLFIYACKDSPLQWRKVIQTAWPPAFAALVAALILLIVSPSLFILKKIGLILLMDATGYVFLYCVILILLPGGKLILSQGFGLIKFWFSRTPDSPVHRSLFCP